MTGPIGRNCWLALATMVSPAVTAAEVPRTTDRVATRAESPTRPNVIAVASVDVSDRVIRKAIADSKDPLDDVVPVSRGSFGTGGPTARQRIDQRFKEAEIPTCLTADAFKFDPPSIGPVVFSGFLALPFWAHAIATGRCRH